MLNEFVHSYTKKSWELRAVISYRHKILLRANFSFGFAIATLLTILYLAEEFHEVPVAIILFQVISTTYGFLMLYLAGKLIKNQIRELERDKLEDWAAICEYGDACSYARGDDE